jgi:hypothetical protein
MSEEFFAIIHCRANHGVRVTKNKSVNLGPMSPWINNQVVPCAKIMRITHRECYPAPVAG